MVAKRVVLILITVSLAAFAQSFAQSIAAQPASPLGIVLLHGKKGSPAYLASTKTALQNRGYLVSTPEMCWSERRLYDRLYPECLTEIDAAVADLRQRGVKAIVIAGHSLGGAAAIAYGASHKGLAGVIGFSAGDPFFGPPSMLPDIARAQRLVGEGKGNTMDEFADFRVVGNGGMRTTAAHFLSFVAQPPEQMMPATVARLKVPLLLVAGTRDVNILRYNTRAFARPQNDARDRLVQVEADHNGTLQAGLATALEWLAGLPRGS